jgi:hypothetical protein
MNSTVPYQIDRVCFFVPFSRTAYEQDSSLPDTVDSACFAVPAAHVQNMDMKVPYQIDRAALLYQLPRYILWKGLTIYTDPALQ